MFWGLWGRGGDEMLVSYGELDGTEELRRSSTRFRQTILNLDLLAWSNSIPTAAWPIGCHSIPSESNRVKQHRQDEQYTQQSFL